MVRVLSLAMFFLFESCIWVNTEAYQCLEKFKEEMARISMVILHPAAIATALKYFVRVAVIVPSSPTKSALAATGVAVAASTLVKRRPTPSLAKQTNQRSFPRIINVIAVVLWGS